MQVAWPLSLAQSDGYGGDRSCGACDYAFFALSGPGLASSGHNDVGWSEFPHLADLREYVEPHRCHDWPDGMPRSSRPRPVHAAGGDWVGVGESGGTRWVKHPALHATCESSARPSSFQFGHIALGRFGADAQRFFSTVSRSLIRSTSARNRLISCSACSNVCTAGPSIPGLGAYSFRHS
jgi:hypothetical protein